MIVGSAVASPDCNQDASECELYTLWSVMGIRDIEQRSRPTSARVLGKERPSVVVVQLLALLLPQVVDQVCSFSWGTSGSWFGAGSLGLPLRLLWQAFWIQKLFYSRSEN